MGGFRGKEQQGNFFIMGRLSKRELLTEKKTESKKKKQTMKKKLFKTRLLSFAAFCGLALAFASCANEDVAQSTTGTNNKNDKSLTTFVAGDEAKTRTSMDYTSGDFYWEAGDKIYVKDDDGTWQVSSNAPTSKVASFQFKVPGKFNNSATYKVYYPGKNSSNDQVTISATQTQTTPNTTKHFGESGDCGTADATGTIGGGVFNFRLDHQAAILVFQPYTSNIVLKDCYLTKIEVTSNNDITDTYTLDPVSGELSGTGNGKQIILTTLGSGSYAYGFPLTNTSANVTTNGAYMVIKPGTHTLKVRYWVQDLVTGIEGTITRNLSTFNYAKNTYYDMTANLDVKDYDGDHYYMWDAKKQYWDGWEWTKNLSGGQPTLEGNTSSNYAQNNTDPRYYNESYPGFGLNNPATYSCAIAPNVNEMVWYAVKGDPRWDNTELWTTMGHLYNGGFWIKKKANITGFRDDIAPDGIDYRSQGYTNNWSTSTTPPSSADIGNYFYIPALGDYAAGTLYTVGRETDIWSSSGYPMDTSGNSAYSLSISRGNIGINTIPRSMGCRVMAFE